MSIKRLVSAKSTALLKNTTRRDGDFQGRPERPGLAFGKGHGVTFARGIRQKHTGFLIKKIKGRNCDDVDIEHSGRKAVRSVGEFEKSHFGLRNHSRNLMLKLISESSALQLKDYAIIPILATSNSRLYKSNCKVIIMLFSTEIN